MNRLLPVLLVVTALTSGACGNTSTSPSTAIAFSQQDLRIGTGTEVANGMVLTVNYTGWLYDPTRADFKGLQFDSSIGSTPYSFTLGTAQVIPGWDKGILGMKVGGARRLIVPSSLAYGGTRFVSVPPYATLVFDIDLLDAQPGS